MREEDPSEERETGASTRASVATLTGARKAGIFSGHFRWVICALLFFGVTKNYMDRQVAVLKGTLQRDLGFNDIDYGNLVLRFRPLMRWDDFCRALD